MSSFASARRLKSAKPLDLSKFSLASVEVGSGDLRVVDGKKTGFSTEKIGCMFSVVRDYGVIAEPPPPKPVAP